MIRWLALAAILIVVTGCGGGAGDGEIVVGAAASLTAPMAAIAREYPDARVRIEFAGSGAIGARVRQGAPIDVLVSADPALSKALHAERLAGRPREVAGNELVVLARRDSDVVVIDDIHEPGARLAVGIAAAPVGAYARRALRALGPAIKERALANVRSQELDARGLTAKLDQGVVDAAIAYRTDAAPLREPARVIPFPAGVAPEVRYVASTTSSSPAAAAFLRWLSGPRARAEFRRAGFAVP